MGHQLTLSERIGIYKSKGVSWLKSVFFDDVPPGVHYGRNGQTPTTAAIKAFSERYGLASLFPYEAYDEETGLYFNSDSVGFMLFATCATGLDSIALKTLNGFFNQSHKAEANIQVSIISDTNVEPIFDRWAETKGQVDDKEIAAIFNTLAKNRVDYLRSGKWDSLFSDQALLIRNYHLVITYSIPVQKGMPSVDIAQDDIDLLLRTRESAIGTLRSANIHSQNMAPTVFLNIMNGIWNPSKDRQPILQYDENELISKQMIDQDTVMLVNSSCASIIHKDKHFTAIPFHVRQFPQRWAGMGNGELIGSFTNNVLRLPCPFIITLTVNAADQVSQKGKASRKSTRATQMKDTELAKYVPQWKERATDWEFTSKKIDNGNKLMEGFYQIVLFCPEGKEQACEQALLSLYGSFGWVVSRSRMMPVHAMLGAMPMGMNQDVKDALKKFGHYRTLLSWTCTNIAPWVGEWKGTRTPMMMFPGRKGQIAYFDPFDNTKGNFNISCCAAPGSGKSFFTNEWVFSCLGMGGRAFLIDAGGSYKNLCKLLKGTYIEFGDPALTIRLNPFSTINDEDPKFFKEQLPLLILLVAQMASPERALSSKQKSVLEKGIMKTWEKHKSKSTITKVVESLLGDNTDDGPMHATAKDLAVMLHSYTDSGMYSEYFEGDSNVDLNNRFVVLELDALNTMPDLQSVVLLILMMRITQVMYLSNNKAQRKLCIIDEAWRLLGRGRSGEFIEEGYRVARKHGGSFMTITQKISDYYQSETARAAYMSSDFSIYLRQKPEELTTAEANKYLDNSDGKIDVLRSLETIAGKYSELAIMSPDGMSVMRFITDPITEKLYSTKAEEVQFIRDAERSGVHIFDAVNELIRRGAKR